MNKAHWLVPVVFLAACSVWLETAQAQNSIYLPSAQDETVFGPPGGSEASTLPPARAQAAQDSAPNPEADVPGIRVSEEEMDRLGRYYDFVVVANKTPNGAETITTQHYRGGQRVDESFFEGQKIAKPQGTILMSSGKEVWKCGPKLDQNGSKIGLEWQWTGTRTGYFTPTRLDIDHVSGQFSDAPMFYASFFDGGRAIHYSDELEHIGDRASHGCMRTETNTARYIFASILQTGALEAKSAYEARCPHVDRKSEAEAYNCMVKSIDRQKEYDDFINDVVAEGNALGTGPWQQKPLVPTINRDGTFTSVSGERVRDFQPGSTDQVKMKSGYASVIVVECINPDGSDCSRTSIPPQPTCGCLRDGQERCQGGGGGSALSPQAQRAIQAGGGGLY
jgi:hypothetical protein